MIIMLKRKRLMLICLSVFVLLFTVALFFGVKGGKEKEKSYIRWAEMNVCYEALADTMELDIETYDKLYHISWIDSLSYLAVKNGNNWSSYSKKELEKMISELGEIYTVDDLMADNGYYTFYKEVFSAILGGFLAEYKKQIPDGNGGKTVSEGYGLVAYSPVAEGFYYSHYDDFGVSRSYGYRRSHLGNDLMGYVGTPIVAVEGGTVECCGWNQYGGWRLGIRSFDGKRSYYYAHLRKDSPYAEGVELGSVVKAGQVIGYMGMTGYSVKENVNGMSTPHLHLGMQLIFNESQKEGTNQIWIDIYSIVKLLYKNRATVVRTDEGEYVRKYDIVLDCYPEQLQELI